MKQKLFKKRSLALWTALSLILSGLSLPPLEAEAEVGTNETVVYVDGVNGNDVSAGDSADTAVKTMGAAFAKVPTDNTKTTIVISGDVDLSNSGLVNYNDAQYETTDSDFDYTYIIPAHSGEVVITSKLGQEDYTDTASLNFGSENKYSYILEGSITFADINISNYASVIYANFYNLTLGQGITSTSEYYPAKVVYLGYWRAKGSYNKTNDSAFVMNSGKLQKFYAGTCSWDTTFSKMSTTINGGTIGTLYGTTNWSAKNASSMQSKVQIAINGGTVNTCYGVGNMAYVGDGGVSITLNKDANVTTVSAVEPVKGTRVAKLDGKATLNLVGYDAEAEVPATISDFDYLELINSAVEIGTLWEKLTDVYMTDNSALTLGAVPAANINVTVQKSGENWIADTALVTAPLAAASMITLTADAEDDFTGYEFKRESGADVTWKISEEEGSGITESVIYVDGVSGDDTKAGTSAATALKTMAAAYAKIPSGNTKTTIVVSGNVDVSNSGLVDYSTYESSYTNTLMFPAHSGEVVITSKFSGEDYTGTASLNFGSGNDYCYMLQGSTTFADINISGYAKEVYANFYNLTLGKGITGASTYYPAQVVYLGYTRQKGSYNETDDSEFIMNSGKLQKYYAGTCSWNTTYSKMSTNINGGTIDTLYGTTNWSSKDHLSLQSSVQITINGGTINNCYGVCNMGNVGDGGVNITINKNANVTTVSAVEPVKYNRVGKLTGKATLNLVGYDENATLPTTISGFDQR